MPLSWVGRKAFAGELLCLCFVESVRGWRGPLNFDSETVRAMARGLFRTFALFLLLPFVVAIRAPFLMSAGGFFPSEVQPSSTPNRSRISQLNHL
jgi:hypothetical protein